MKRFLSLLLCIVLVCVSLVSCAEDGIGSYLPNYDPDNMDKVEELKLNLYIIVGEGTSENAMISVAREINAHTYAQLKTNLNVHYIKASEYQEKVNGAIAAGGDNAPHIVLINSEAMMNELVSAGKLHDLTELLNTKPYSTLKGGISQALLEGSKIDGKFYCVPNNHRVGEYEYLVISKSARDKYKYSNEQLQAMNSLEDAAALMADITAAGEDPAEMVFTRNGEFELKAQYEANGYFCNVVKAPVVTAAEAFSGAFAVVKNSNNKYNERAMQIIYELNTDNDFRNLLQYGVQDTHYTIEDEVVTRHTDGDNAYYMDLLHTGNVFGIVRLGDKVVDFHAYYCEELNWTEADHNNAKQQNNAADANLE